MSTQIRDVWRVLARSSEERAEPEPETSSVGIAPNDPLVAYLQSARGVVDLDRLELESPALDVLKEAGVKLAVPLVAQGELIGMLNLGPRLSEQEYSVDDRALLSSLAIQAAPALRVAQLVRQQKEEARRRERLDQELRIARLIQQTLLPRELPELPGWEVAAYYRPAREVGGDFYDFVELPDGKLGLIVADVTDKANPEALSSAAYPNVGYAHQGWITEDHKYFFLGDELDEMNGSYDRTRTMVWDVTDLDDPILTTEFMGTTGAIDHNLYIKGNTMYQSNYVAGMRVIDISDPENPRETGYFDTVPYGDNSASFNGSWSNYPYFASGTIVVTSGREGVFFLKNKEQPVP